MEEREIQHRIIKELREKRDSPIEPQADWDVIWVLSGPEISINEVGGQDGNETKDRLYTGSRLVREVTAVRLKKEESAVTLEDIRAYGPKLLYNGTDAHNQDLKAKLGDGAAETNMNIPRENFIICGNGIVNTPDQFKQFPPVLAQEYRKIILVTDLYHIPRTRRTARNQNIDNQTNPVQYDKLILYPSSPKRYPVGLVLKEVRKVPKLITKGYLPQEES